MGGSSTASRHTPKCKITVDGTTLSSKLISGLREIYVDQATDMADAFVFVLHNDGAKASDAKELQPGKKVEIELGYQDNGGKTTKVIEGEITALKAVFPRKGVSTLRVHGLTKFHRLKRGRYTRAFNGLTYTQIAQKIAKEVGLTPACDPTQPAHEYVFQRNQSNLEFLTLLADRVGFEVFANDGKLFFRKPTPDSTSVRKLEMGKSLLSFNPRIQAARVPQDVYAQDWDYEKKDFFFGESKATDAPAGMGGQTSAPDVAKPLGEARNTFYEHAFKDKDEATNFVKAVMKESALNLVYAEASTQGMPDLRPGFVVEVDEVGPIFSGQYYITRVVHDYLPHGFATRLGLRRTSLDKPPA
ncbi:MAG: phage late control D family protein, partial [Polyangiaceae bacterium]